MNTMVSRTMAALVVMGCLAGQAAATPENGQYEDWRVVATFPLGQVWSIAVAPSDPSRVYAAVYNGYNAVGYEAELHRSDNGGDGWAKVAFSGYCAEQELAINPADKNLILGARWSEANPILCGGSGGGSAWTTTEVWAGMPLVWDPNDSNIVYAGRTLFSGVSGYVMRSVDSGATWTTSFSWPWNGVSATNTGNLATPIVYCAGDRVYRLAGPKSSADVVVTDITGNLPGDLNPSSHPITSYYTCCWDPKLPSRIIVYTSPTPSSVARVFRTTNATDLAVSWQEVTTNGLPSGGFLGFLCSPSSRTARSGNGAETAWHTVASPSR